MAAGRNRLGAGVLGAGLLALVLAGCSTGNFVQSSAFGDNKLKVAELEAVDMTTSGGALATAKGHFRSSNFGYSAAYYKRAAELAPNNPQAYVGLAASYDRLGRYDLSDRVYAALYKLDGGSAQYYNNLGYSHMLRGNLTKALTNFRKAQAIAPGNPVVENNLKLLAGAAQIA